MSPNHPLAKNRGCFSFVGWALLLGGAFFLTMAVLQTRLPLFGKTTDGLITKVTERVKSSQSSSKRYPGESDSDYRERTRRVGISYDLHVRFTPEGGAPTDIETSSTFGKELNQGDAVKVIYLPSNPTNAEIHTTKQLWLPLLTGYIVSFLCLGGGWFLRMLTKSMEVL
jgi:Protein of unknown function (DUF3592)